MIIRIPKFSELEQIVALGQVMHQESAFVAPYDPDYSYYMARKSIERYHDKEGGFICVAATDDGIIVGFMMATLTPYIYSPMLHAVDMGLYVLPDFRGTSAAFRMIKMFEEWAQQCGALETKFGVSTGTNIERSHRFFTRLGYNHLGGVFCKTIGTENG